MNARLTRIASRYYDTWTTDGIDDFHADVDEIAAWLKREDLRTAEDADLQDLTDDEIDAIAAAISDMVKENLPKSDEEDKMKTITLLNCEFTACTAIAASVGDTERQNAVLVHDLNDEFRDGDFVAFGYDLPEDEEDARNILKDYSSHSTDAEDLETIVIDGDAE